MPPSPHTEVRAGTVHLALAAETGNVRLARLVAVAVGRLYGADGPLLDDLRLAVGEACTRAVLVHAEVAPESPVLVDIDADAEALVVTVSSHEPAGRGTSDGWGLLAPYALIDGLADELDVRSDPAGTTVVMRWRLRQRPTERSTAE